MAISRKGAHVGAPKHVQEMDLRVIRCRFIFLGKNDGLTPDFPGTLTFKPIPMTTP